MMIGEAQGGHLIAKIFNGSGDKATMTNELLIEKIK
ncbi:DNA/RNA non-specific endonuclease [Veillonella sp. ACP1]|nr:DNA/RNA non-specific endonuclease [Veillonella sp. ACP1]